MIVPDQVQDAVGFVEDIKRGKDRTYNLREVRDTYLSNTFDIETVDLPGQRSDLLQERKLLRLPCRSSFFVFGPSIHA